MRWQVRDVLTREQHLALIGLEHAGDQMDQRCFARTIGTD